MYPFQGLLREDDLQHFDEDFRKNFKTSQADSLSENSWEDDWMFPSAAYYSSLRLQWINKDILLIKKTFYFPVQ